MSQNKNNPRHICRCRGLFVSLPKIYTIMYIPRELIYEDKSTLDDFGYKDEKSFDGQIYKGLLKIKDMKPGDKGFYDRLLTVYNDTYLICSMVVKLEKSVWTLSYYKQFIRIPSVVLPMVYCYLSRLDRKPEHLESFLTALHTDIEVNGWSGNLEILRNSGGKNAKTSVSAFNFRELTSELLDTIKWWKVTERFRQSEIRKVLINIPKNKEEYSLILDAIGKSAKEYEWEYNNHLEYYEGINEDGILEFYEDKPIDLSNVFKYCDEWKERYEDFVQNKKRKQGDDVSEDESVGVIIKLQNFLKKSWFDELSSNRLFNKNWRETLVSDLIASEFGPQIVEEWNMKKGTRSKSAQIKMQLVRALTDAGVFGKHYKKEIVAKIKSSALEMSPKDASLLEYMRFGHPYSEWLREYIDKHQAENPNETPN